MTSSCIDDTEFDDSWSKFEAKVHHDVITCDTGYLLGTQRRVATNPGRCLEINLLGLTRHVFEGTEQILLCSVGA